MRGKPSNTKMFDAKYLGFFIEIQGFRWKYYVFTWNTRYFKNIDNCILYIPSWNWNIKKYATNKNKTGYLKY